tara:strand:- start:50052 stop:50294 length:243 start_codon:yes stop_codon:yes gene_type:complete
MVDSFRWISALVIVILVLLWWYFRYHQQRNKRRHSHQCERLQKTLILQRKQIAKRHIALDRYDFLQYNLEDALLVQQEIK